jgi:hypothetical protein
LKQITKEQLGAVVIKNTTAQQKSREVLHLFELLSNIGNDVFNDLYHSSLGKDKKLFMNNFLNRLLELQELIRYCNQQFKEISNIYSQSVPYIKVSNARTYNGNGYGDVSSITYFVDKKKFEKPESTKRKSKKATNEENKEKKPRKPRAKKNGKEKASKTASASESETGTSDTTSTTTETITIEDSDDNISEEYDIPEENIVIE